MSADRRWPAVGGLVPHGANLPGCAGEAVVEPLLSLAAWTAQEALADSRLPLDALDPYRVGCVVGTSKGGWRAARP